MALFDSRAVVGGLAGAVVFALLRRTTRQTSSSPAALLADTAAATAYYSLAGASSRPVLTGVLLGVGAGVGSALLPRRHGTPATVGGIALHALAGAAAGVVYAGLSNDWPAEDFGEAFFP